MSKLLFTSLLLMLYHGMSSQECTGNLGENIFGNGDFGSGTNNILERDPFIAPGYLYQFNPPPDDGFYTVTNNTASWGSFASNWDNIQDNSPDPNGYMMIVNASFDPGIFYEQLITDLCDNTLYYFSVDVYNLINSINPNISFQLDGVTEYTTGSIPYNGQWNTYGFTFTTAAGQSSLTLSLSNNAPGGNGNDLALDNISFRACGPSAQILPAEVADICQDGSPIALDATIVGNQYVDPQVQWQLSTDGGFTWNDIAGANATTYLHTDLSAGIYYYRYLLANGVSNLSNSKCRVVSNVKIVNVISKFYTITDTICQGLSFPFDNKLLTAAGTYQDSLLTTSGCDSIVVLDLVVVPEANIELFLDTNDPSCFGFEDGAVNIANIISGSPPYQIMINGNNSSNQALMDLAAGSYSYLVTDRHGCTTQAIAVLADPDPFTVSLGQDQEIDLGETIIIDPIYSASASMIEWIPGESLDCSMADCESLDLLALHSQQYILMAQSSTGCLASDTINIKVNKVRKVYIPNTFSPNQDGVNDFFAIYASTPNVDIIESLSIYDRWGNLLYQRDNIEANNESQGWSGYSNRHNYPPGIYSYKVDIKFLDGEVIPYSGTVMLSR